MDTASCRICAATLIGKLDFGSLPLANNYVTDVSLPEPTYPAIWAWCPECQLLQLVDPPSAAEMFTDAYPYRTSTSRTMLDHFQQAARDLDGRYDPVTVAEIGCSDGGVLQFLPQCATVGFEPAAACWPALDAHGILHYDTFSRANVQTSQEVMQAQYDLIFSANTLRSIPRLHEVLSTAKEALHPITGVLVIEEPYLPPILARNELDQFYDENVYCFTATALDRIARIFDLYLYDAEPLAVHGGSLRYHMSRANAPMTAHLRQLIAAEANLYDQLDGFMERAYKIGYQFSAELVSLREQGQRVVGYGATAKSSTILCDNGIRSDLIECIYDNSPAKIGKYTPLTHIPIVDAEQFKDDPAEVVVLFAWNYADEIIERENAIRKRNWLSYIPRVEYL